MRRSKSRELGCEIPDDRCLFFFLLLPKASTSLPQTPPPLPHRRRGPLGPSRGIPSRRVASTGRPPIRLPGSSADSPIPPGGAAIPSHRRRWLLRRRGRVRRRSGADAAAAVLRPAAWRGSAAAGVWSGGAYVCWVSFCILAFFDEREKEEDERRKNLSLSRPHRPLSMNQIDRPQGPDERKRLPRSMPSDSVLLLPPQPLRERKKDSRGALGEEEAEEEVEKHVGVGER